MLTKELLRQREIEMWEREKATLHGSCSLFALYI